MATVRKGKAIVVKAGGGESYWQPLPANGYAEVHLSRRNLPEHGRFSTGIQVIAPNSRVREHSHRVNEEILFFFEGQGHVLVDGTRHEVGPGTTVYVGPLVAHEIVNDGPSDLKMMWTLLPGGLEEFFQAIGRPRSPGEPAPAPFPRPENAGEIEAATVFAAAPGRGPEGRR